MLLLSPLIFLCVCVFLFFKKCLRLSPWTRSSNASAGLFHRRFLFLLFIFFLHLFDGHSKCALPSSFLNLASFFFRILFYYYSDEENPSHPVWLCRQHAPPMWWMSDKRFNGALGLLSFSIPSHWWILLCLTWSPTAGCRIRNPCRWRIGPAPPASS